MNQEITKIIDQYLQGELSEADRLVFEQRLSESDILRKEVEFQKTIYEAAKRASTRTQVKQAGKSYHFTKKIQFAGIALAIMATISILAFFIAKNANQTKSGYTEELVSLMNKLEKESPIDLLKSEFFLWDGADSVVLSDQGVLLSIPKNAFLLDGLPYSEKALIQWQEALDGATIVKSGLSTMSGDRMLETQGMFSVQAFTPEGKRLTVNPKTGIYVQVPVDEYKTGMQLFEGKKNAAGIVDWQNPTPLQKIPVPVDMSKLDFYPVGYEDTLDKMKLQKDKKFRDSLYLSYAAMSESYADTLPHDASEIGSLFHSTCATCHQFTKDATGPKLANVREKWAAGGAKSGSIYQWVKDWSKAAENDPYAAEVAKLKPVAMMRFPDLSNELIDELFDYIDGQSNHFGIDPARVIAFWNPKFNNTNLATREFEKRMLAVHGTCNNEVLKIYTDNLSQPLSKLDKRVAEMGYIEFEWLAAEQVGAVNPGNPHLKNLSRFYERSMRQLQEEAHNNRGELQRKQQKWDNEMQQERSREQIRSNERNLAALEEEYDYNLKNVYRQLGKVYNQLQSSVGFTITGGASIYNIDRQVFEATAARESRSFSDPETGKSAKITYNDFTFEIEDATQYDQVFAYLFPSGINSYQRISGTDGKFSYPLNDDLQYDLAIVGLSEKGYSYFQQKSLNKGALGKLTLKNVSETRLNASIQQLNNARLYNPMDMKAEISWLIQERKDYKVQRQRQERKAFEERIRKIVLPCFEQCDCADSTDTGVALYM